MKKLIPEEFPTLGDRIKAQDYWKSKSRPDLTARIDDIVAEFRAHHETRGNRFVSWTAAWKTWYVRVVRFIEPPKRSKDPRAYDPSKNDRILQRYPAPARPAKPGPI